MPSVRIRMRQDQLQLDFGEGNEHIAVKFMRSFHNGQVPREYRKGPAFQYNQDGEVPKLSETRPYILRFPTYVAEDGDRGINFGSEQARNGFLSALKKLAGRREQQHFDWLKTFPGDPTLSNALYIRSQYLDPEFHNESGVGVEIAQFPHRRVSQRIGPPVVPEPNPAFQLLSALGLGALLQDQGYDAAEPDHAVSQQPAHNPAANASAPPQVNNPQLKHIADILKFIEDIAPRLELRGFGTPNDELTKLCGKKVKLSTSLTEVYNNLKDMQASILSGGNYQPHDIEELLIQPMQKLNAKTQTWKTKQPEGLRAKSTTRRYDTIIGMVRDKFNLALASAPAYPQAEAPLAFSLPQPGAPTPPGVAATATLLYDHHEQMEGHMEGQTPQTPGATSSGPSAPPGQ